MNKKGISEMVSYVLLIVIGIAISIFVYNFLRPNISTDSKPECNKEIAITIDKAWCANNVDGKDVVYVKMTNKGLFKIDAVYIRAEKSDKEVLKLINDQKDEDMYFIQVGVGKQGLMPGTSGEKTFVPNLLNLLPGTEYTLEVEPAIFDKNVLALCPQSIVYKKITCTEGIPGN